MTVLKKQWIQNHNRNPLFQMMYTNRQVLIFHVWLFFPILLTEILEKMQLQNYNGKLAYLGHASRRLPFRQAVASIC